MKIDFSFFNNETQELVNRDIKMICVDKENNIFVPEDPYSMVVIFNGIMVVTNEEAKKDLGVSHGC